MDPFLSNLKQLLVILVKQDYGTPLFWGILAVAVVALFFIAGTVSRVIFGIDGGLPKTFLAQFLVAAVFLAGTAAALTWVQPSLVTSAIIGGILAIGALVALRKMLGGKLGPAIGITVFSLGLFVLIAQFGGQVAKSLANKAETLKPANDPKFEKAS